jgi:hypothetical protein
MLFQIISSDKCFAIDLTKIDIIQIEDSGVLGAEDRYALCFYVLGQEMAAEYSLKRLTLEQRHALFEQVCKYKENPRPEYNTYTVR